MATDSTRETHAEWIAARLTESGINAILVSTQQDDRGFGNAEAIYRVDSLLLRFVRDRGQDFLDIAMVELPTRFYQFGAVEIAMGWQTTEQVLSKRKPQNLIAVIDRVKANLAVLKTAFDVDHRRDTMANLEKATAALGKAMLGRFKQ